MAEKHGSLSINSENIYYLDTSVDELNIQFEKNGESKTQNELNSYEFFQNLNTDDAWIYRGDRAPVLKMPVTSARNITELEDQAALNNSLICLTLNTCRNFNCYINSCYTLNIFKLECALKLNVER